MEEANIDDLEEYRLQFYEEKLELKIAMARKILLLTLDMNNNGVVEWFEFLHNFAANMDETVKDPYIDLKPFLPDEVIQQTAQLLCANPWQTTQFEKVVSI